MRSLLALSLLTSAVSGCSTHQCDASTSNVDDSKQHANPVNGTYVWDSAKFHGWITYNGNETITFMLPSNFPSTSTEGFTLSAYTATSTDPSCDVVGQFVEAAGQLAEFQIAGLQSFTVVNDTCSQYCLRVVATVTVPSAPVDAGPDAPHD